MQSPLAISHIVERNDITSRPPLETALVDDGMRTRGTPLNEVQLLPPYAPTSSITTIHEGGVLTLSGSEIREGGGSQFSGLESVRPGPNTFGSEIREALTLSS